MGLRVEKRTVPRVPVSMKVDSAQGATVGFGYAKDISEKGMAVDAQALVDNKKVPCLGEKLRMRFTLPKSGLVITVTGKVVRVMHELSTAPLIAMEFIDLNSEFRQAIARYVGAYG